VPYLTQVVIGLDRASEEQYRAALQFFDRLPQPHSVLWHDGPRLRALDKPSWRNSIWPRGKRARAAMSGIAWATCSGGERVESIAIHDCDILTYERSCWRA
jgi:glucosyl-3-phosphoglycerate synthase